MVVLLTIAANLMGSHITPFLITDFNMVSTVIIVLTFVIAVVKGSFCCIFIGVRLYA
jgi:hypothetical protein